MQTLELDCPSCGEHLELDTGFAGGVCRCSNCGTLMTVPRDAGRAERLTAPERGAELSDATIDPADLQELAPPRPAPRAANGKRGKKGKAGRGASASTSTIEAGEYRTASGKVVRVEQATRVPMAQSKRKKIRMITTIVFMSVILCVAVIAAVAIWAMISSGKQGGERASENGTQNEPAPPTTYDSSANPYTLTFANIAGIPVQGKVAIVTEASKGDSEFWMPAAGQMIRAGLGRGDTPSTQVAFFAAQKGAPAEYEAGGATSLTRIDQPDLKKWFDGLTYAKPVDRTAAIERALKTKPDVLVLVFSGATGQEMANWGELFKGKAGMQVHGVLIDSLSARPVLAWFRDLKSGEAIALSTSEIKAWGKEVAESEGE